MELQRVRVLEARAPARVGHVTVLVPVGLLRWPVPSRSFVPLPNLTFPHR